MILNKAFLAFILTFFVLANSFAGDKPVDQLFVNIRGRGDILLGGRLFLTDGCTVMHEVSFAGFRYDDNLEDEALVYWTNSRDEFSQDWVHISLLRKLIPLLGVAK